MTAISLATLSTAAFGSATESFKDNWSKGSGVSSAFKKDHDHRRWGRHRRNKKDFKFINGHDARDGKFDRRGRRWRRDDRRMGNNFDDGRRFRERRFRRGF